MAVPIGTEEEAGGVEGMKALIDAYDGNLAAIARHLRVHRTSVLRVIQRHPELQDHLESARHMVFDDIENELIRKAKAGDLIAIMFYLKCHGTRLGRPYHDRPTQEELRPQIEAPITFDEWKLKQEKARADVRAMLEDFSIDAEATRVE